MGLVMGRRAGASSAIHRDIHSGRAIVTWRRHDRHAEGMRSDDRDLRRLIASQDGVISRAQLVQNGTPPGLLADRVRQGRWQSPYPGVAVVHTGPLEWRPRARAALLYSGAASALSHSAAAYQWGIPRDEPRVVEVSIPADRRVSRQPGLRVHIRRRMPDSYGVLRTVHPPETVLDLWEAVEDADAAIALLAAASRARVSMREVVQGAAARRRLKGRALLADLLAEVRDGVESPLESRYRHDVERRHGLPRSELQLREVVGRTRIRADVVYRGLGVRVELDGVLGHPGGRTAHDTWRDNSVAIERRELTLRYRWTHVAATPCATAAQVARALADRGWQGGLTRCGTGCRLDVDGTS